MICNRCGAENTNDSKYCFRCGNQLVLGVNNSQMNTNQNMNNNFNNNGNMNGNSFNQFESNFNNQMNSNQNMNNNFNNNGNMNENSFNQFESNFNNQMNSNQNMNNNFNNSNITHDSMLRKAIKNDSKKLPKKNIVLSNLILIGAIIVILIIVSIIFKTVGNGNGVYSLIVTTVISLIGLVFIFGQYYVALKTARHEQTSVMDTVVMPLKNIKKLSLVLIIILALQLLPQLLSILFLNLDLYVVGNIINVFLTVLFVILYPTLSISAIIAMDDRKKFIQPIQVIKEASKMVRGHKIQFYAMFLSFFGWMLLSGLTLGILLLWLVPYVQLSMINMYRNWNKENGYVGTEKGISNKAIVIIFGIWFALGLLSNLFGSNTSSELTGNNTSFDYSKVGGETVTKGGVTIYVPNTLEYQGYQDGYIFMNEDETEEIIIGSIDNSAGTTIDIEEFTKGMYQNYINNQYSCSSSEIKTINGREWGKIKCQENSTPMITYLTDGGNKVYLIVVSSYDTLMIKKVEQSLKLEDDDRM